jgi:Holliday junction resolvase RusA-like endonuclease
MGVAFYPVAPMPKPRMTQRDKWKKRPVVVRYHAWCDEIRRLGVALPRLPAKVTFYVEMPKSWSKRKRQEMHLRPHESERGDKDNFEKALLDALFVKDGHVWSLWAEKRWSHDPGILIEPLETVEVYRCNLCGGKQLGPAPAFCARDGCKQQYRASGIMRLEGEDTP